MIIGKTFASCSQKGIISESLSGNTAKKSLTAKLCMSKNKFRNSANKAEATKLYNSILLSFYPCKSCLAWSKDSPVLTLCTWIRCAHRTWSCVAWSDKMKVSSDRCAKKICQLLGPRCKFLLFLWHSTVGFWAKTWWWMWPCMKLASQTL